ncbi:unnamed protein product [Cyprideis torosa]|uniref:E3 UFM1-protein ligase 1 homolog n=1 Tax=Cyprideis torosa TaxID=163714 RepID=A0A7R8ZP00_9CRUS|nr:unnamed protein product [Cyprideis torosa]CAG0897590.1 unnamed protein product [Cyprideis torosa]
MAFLKPKTGILDKSLSRGKNEVHPSTFALLFSEIVQYCQNRSMSVSELQQKLSELGFQVGTRLLDLLVVRDRGFKRDIKVLNILLFVKTTVWKSLFGKEADKLEHANDDERTFYLIEENPLVNRFVSVPKDKGSLNCAAFIGGIIEAILCNSGFVSDCFRSKAMAPSSDWEEVKRLAADFQRAQLASAVQKLSERNCVEIVSKLIELKLLEVYFTKDGKEYITPAHLSREILFELEANGGRVNLVDLSATLNIDLSHVENRAADVAAKNHHIQVVLGQLIDSSYLDGLAEEINDKLQEDGQISLSDVARVHDLPPEFVQKQVERRLGSLIQAQQDSSDPRLLFTEAFVSRVRARVRGVLSAVTQPVSCSTIIQNHGIPERLFYSIADQLIRVKRVSGIIQGGRQGGKAMFIPSIYTKAQATRVKEFYQQNGFIEYDMLNRLGISEAESYIRKMFPSEELLFLENCACGPILSEHIEAAVEEVMRDGGFVDVMPMLPPSFAEGDAEVLLHRSLGSTAATKASKLIVLAQTVLLSKDLLDRVMHSFQPLLEKRATEEAIRSSTLPSPTESSTPSGGGKKAGGGGSTPKGAGGGGTKDDDDWDDGKKSKKDERRKRAQQSAKTGGGTQGREGKTKATKKKYRPGGKGKQEDESGSDDGDETGPRHSERRVFLQQKQILKALKEVEGLDEASDEMLEALADKICRPLLEEFNAKVSHLMASHLSESSESRKKAFTEYQVKIQGLANNIHLFQKGLTKFSGEVGQNLEKYLLRSLVSQMANILLEFLVHENQLQVSVHPEATFEARATIIHQFSQPLSTQLGRLNKALNGASVADAMEAMQPILDDSGLNLRATDKKKEKQLASTHRQTLIEQLSQCSDPALTLHLTCLILFQSLCHEMIHASGKFVPHILSILKPLLEQEVYDLLTEFQGLVVKDMNSESSDEQSQAIKDRLNELSPKVKDVAVNTKKIAGSGEK